MTDPDGEDVLEYDDLDRLKKGTRRVGGVDVSVEDYAYNALGALKLNAGVALDDQRPRLDGAGTADAAVPATLGGQPVTLNAGGIITSLLGTTFTWNERGQLTAAQDPVPAAPETFTYDSHLRRATQAVGSNVEFNIYEGLDRIAVMNNTGQPTTTWLFDGIDHPLRCEQAAAQTLAATATPPLARPSKTPPSRMSINRCGGRDGGDRRSQAASMM
jgi:hypothetical protein